jgi:hypothetical protein
MTLLEFLNPVIVWETLNQVIKNESNRQFYKRKMRELEKNGSLKQFGMRLDMRGRAYYIINLEPETLLMGAEVLDLEKSRVYESINLRKPMLENAELSELVEAITERIKTKEHYAYLIQIKYRPISGIGNIFHVVSWLTVASIATVYLSRLASRIPAAIDWIRAALG